MRRVLVNMILFAAIVAILCGANQLTYTSTTVVKGFLTGDGGYTLDGGFTLVMINLYAKDTKTKQTTYNQATIDSQNQTWTKKLSLQKANYDTWAEMEYVNNLTKVTGKVKSLSEYNVDVP